jgi:fructose-1,6-bisphosphatase
MTEFVGVLAEHYNIPIITIQSCLEYLDANPADDQLMEDVRDEYENLKAVLRNESKVGRP